MPATMSPQIASLRARDQDLQMALNQKYPPTRLPPLPPSTIGQPPTTRVVPSVSVRPTAPTPQETPAAPGVTIATIPTVPQGSAARNIQQQRQEQASLRTPIRNARLAPGVPAQNYDVSINGPAGLTRQQLAQMPPYDPVGAVVRTAIAPVPMPAGMRPVAPVVAPVRVAAPSVARVAPVPMPAARRPTSVATVRRPVVQAAAPMRIVVQRDRPVVSAMSGMTSAQKYAALNSANYKPTVEDRVRGSSGGDAHAYSLSS